MKRFLLVEFEESSAEPCEAAVEAVLCLTGELFTVEALSEDQLITRFHDLLEPDHTHQPPPPYLKATMSSETTHNLPEQPGNTCPMIDDVISLGNCIFKTTRRYDRLDSVEELHKVISDVESDLFGLTSQMESIRGHVSSIRDWGQAWKELALAQRDELDELEQAAVQETVTELGEYGPAPDRFRVKPN